MLLSLSLLLASLGPLLTSVHALEVTNTSSCADTCNGPSLTYGSDLVCSDDAYSDTSKGKTMYNCLTCESTSSADNNDLSTPQNNDIYWFLFNMKYTLEYCLFESNSTTPSLPECQADCAGLYPVLEASWFSPTAAKQYEYCTINNTAFTQYAGACASCLQAGTGSVVLGNFLDAMQSACTNQPNAVLGETIPIKRALFNTTTIGTATATASATATTSPSQTSGNTVPATTSATVTPTSTTVPASVDKKSSGLSSGAAAGVGVGCGIIAIAMIGLAWFFFRRRAARRQSAPPGYEYGESKPALLSSPVAEDQYPHAQQLGSTEVHEIDSSSGGQGAWTGTNELDGRPLK